MAYITLPEGKPGMHGLLAFRPEVAPSLCALTDALLRSEEGLSRGERELIGAFVSSLNDCFICENIHGAVAQQHLRAGDDFVEKVKSDYQNSEASEKMKALLRIAESVQQGGRFVTADQVEAARLQGATDLEIHDTVLIAALFCLFNRYLDGLGVLSGDTTATFRERATDIVIGGYCR